MSRAIRAEPRHSPSPDSQTRRSTLRFYFVQMLDEGADVGVVVVVAVPDLQNDIHPVHQPIRSLLDIS
jgi:hypothetical protein